MVRPCEQCGSGFEAKSPAARFCGARCRKASSRGTAPTTSVTPVTFGAPGVTGKSTVQACRDELEAGGRSETFLGAAALALADRVDNATAVMGFAALVKELRATMAAAMAGVQVTADEVDELRARRDRKLNAG